MGDWIDLGVLDRLLKQTEVDLVEALAVGRTWWPSKQGSPWSTLGDEGSSNRFIPVSELSSPSDKFDTICVEWSAESGFYDSVSKLVENNLEKGGKIILLGVPDVASMLDEKAFELGLSHIQPYGLLTGNKSLAALLGADYDTILREVAEAIGDEKTFHFWRWLELSLCLRLPTSLTSRCLVVFGEEDRIGEICDGWEQFFSYEVLDAQAFQSMLGESFEQFRSELNTWVTQPTNVDMGPRHLIAILSESLEWRLQRKIDFLSLFNKENQDYLLRFCAWRFAYVAHRTIDPEPLTIEGIALPPLLDFEMYKEVSDVFSAEFRSE